MDAHHTVQPHEAWYQISRSTDLKSTAVNVKTHHTVKHAYIKHCNKISEGSDL